MERWVVGTQGQHSSVLQRGLRQTHPLSPGDPHVLSLWSHGPDQVICTSKQTP